MPPHDSSVLTVDQQSRARIILSLINLAIECETAEEEETAVIYYRAANKLLEKSLVEDSSSQKAFIKESA